MEFKRPYPSSDFFKKCPNTPNIVNGEGEPITESCITNPELITFYLFPISSIGMKSLKKKNRKGFESSLLLDTLFRPMKGNLYSFLHFSSPVYSLISTGQEK